MSLPTCECCQKPNAWALTSNDYLHVCGECVRLCKGVSWIADSDSVERYRRVANCHGCGSVGIVNFGMHDVDYAYFCGGSNPGCMP